MGDFVQPKWGRMEMVFPWLYKTKDGMAKE